MSRSYFVEYFLVFTFLLLALLLRLYKIDIPLADHHSWRQSDTAAVARNFVKERWDFLKPRIDNMTPLHSPDQPNPQRLFLVEPPIYQSVIAGVYRVFGVREALARLVSVVFTLGSMVFLYLITRKYFGSRVGYLALFFFAVLPYSVFYSRVILPEPMIIFLLLGFIWFSIRYFEKEKVSFWLVALFFGSLSLTQKAFPFFFLIPILYLAWRRYFLKVLIQPKLWLFLIISFLPIVVWRLWINQFPEGVPASSWLLNQGDIRFKGAFFWWIFAERLGKLILGYWGLIPLGIGLLLAPTKKEGYFFHLWFLGVLLYTTVFAAGNVTHDYYQIPFVPILVIFLAKGANFVLETAGKLFDRMISYSFLLTCVLFMLSFSWYEVRNFYNIQGGVDLAGRAVDELTLPEALVLTGDSNDATLLYNTNRYGWSGGYASNFPNTPQTIERVRAMGASTYVATKFDQGSEFGKYMLAAYTVIDKTDQYVIFDLSKRKAE